jgi:hypothetical protein
MEVNPIPTFHLVIADTEVSGNPCLNVEWIGASGERRPLKASNIVESPLRGSYKRLGELGRTLYGSLFKEERVGDGFRSHYERHCGVSDEERPGLRLTLDFWVDPERRNLMINLPWELMHDDDDWLLLNPRLSVVRRIHNPAQEVSQHKVRGIDPPMRILFAYAEPPDKDSVEVRESFDVAAETMRSSIGDLLDIEVLPHATKEDLRSRIRSGVHVLHLLGHGDLEMEKAQLGLLYPDHSESPKSDILPATELQNWIEEAEITPRLVVLTACHSGNPSPSGILGVATALLDVGVEAVVSMQTALYTDEARDFTEAFYRGLVKSYWVDDAVRAGREALHNYRSLRGDEVIISSDPASKKATEGPAGRYHPVSFSTFSNGEETSNVVDLPAWSVPTLFLQGAGWLGLELPKSPYTWPGDGKDMIYVEEGRFYVDKYPVTREEYRKFARETGRPIPEWRAVDWEAAERSRGRYFDLADAIRDAWEPNLPATNITVEDAQAYAAWAGKHLPTPEEWRQAALSGCSDKSIPYPWGDNLKQRACNTREGRYHQLWPVILSGERFDSCSPAGVCDTVGNASEWTRDDEGLAYVCGGSFKDWREECTIQSCRLISNPYVSGDSIGFRCAASLNEWMDIVSRDRSS